MRDILEPNPAPDTATIYGKKQWTDIQKTIGGLALNMALSDKQTAEMIEYFSVKFVRDNPKFNKSSFKKAAIKNVHMEKAKRNQPTGITRKTGKKI